MIIKLTSFAPLWSMTKVEATGSLEMGWDGAYESVKAKNHSYRYPRAGGSGQKIQPLKLMLRDNLPENIASLDDGRSGHIYILLSTVYPILYVGISQGNLRNGVFGAGRLGHHMRKIFASHASQTSHTQGWPSHAIDRYRDRVAAYQTSRGLNLKPSNNDGTLVGGDLLIAFGKTDEEWDPADYEGTVLDTLHDSLKLNGIDVQILNTGSVKRKAAVINLPDNIKEVTQNFLSSCADNNSNKVDCTAENEVHLDIDTLANYCESIDPTKVDHVIGCLSGNFKQYWDSQWHARLLERATDWDNIESVSSIAIAIARKGGCINNKLINQFDEIFKIYESSTRIFLKDTDDGYEWKLKPIEELKNSLKNSLNNSKT